MGSKFFEIPIEQYRCRIFIANNISYSSLRKRLKNADLSLEVRNELLSESMEEYDTDAWTVANGPVILVRFHSELENNVIAHELFHAVSHIMRRAGVHLTDDEGTDEAWAYTMGLVFEKFYENI